MNEVNFLKDIAKEEKNFLEAPLYLYGTEAIGDYYMALKLKGKSVLTINGSGDQVLNAYYFGAKKVVGFDIVKNTSYLLDLKIAALKNLEYKEFLDFFGDNRKKGSFDYTKYKSFKKQLKKETKIFLTIFLKSITFVGRIF